MSEHWNGYKRENAVRRLGMLGNPIAIPKLIVRANDWVPQVRNAARESIEKLLMNKNAEAFVYSLPDIYHLQDCGRDNHNTLIDKIERFLTRTENRKYLISSIEMDEPSIARNALKLCIENSLIEKYKLVSICFEHNDVIVRNIASDLMQDLKGIELEE